MICAAKWQSVYRLSLTGCSDPEPGKSWWLVPDSQVVTGEHVLEGTRGIYLQSRISRVLLATHLFTAFVSSRCRERIQNVHNVPHVC